jgi:hypothetical protein
MHELSPEAGVTFPLERAAVTFPLKRAAVGLCAEASD